MNTYYKFKSPNGEYFYVRDTALAWAMAQVARTRPGSEFIYEVPPADDWDDPLFDKLGD